MAPISHQTVKLRTGRHSSPEDGACVVELASMLAGEKFSDHPRSVSRTIAAFLRTYNDRLDDDRRQDLLEIASEIVGTRAGRAVERARGRRCLAWVRAVDGRRHGTNALVWMPGGCAQAAQRAAIVAACGDDNRHRFALALVKELIATGAPEAADRLPGTATPARAARSQATTAS
jgi:hypothetical protein